jgi:hypothetical protein
MIPLQSQLDQFISLKAPIKYITFDPKEIGKPMTTAKA